MNKIYKIGSHCWEEDGLWSKLYPRWIWYWSALKGLRKQCHLCCDIRNDIQVVSIQYKSWVINNFNTTLYLLIVWSSWVKSLKLCVKLQLLFLYWFYSIWIKFERCVCSSLGFKCGWKWKIVFMWFIYFACGYLGS